MLCAYRVCFNMVPFVGFELTTFWLLNRCSTKWATRAKNISHYTPYVRARFWWWRLESSQRPTPYEGVALPLCYITENWCGWEDSNLQDFASKANTSTIASHPRIPYWNTLYAGRLYIGILLRKTGCFNMGTAPKLCSYYLLSRQSLWSFVVRISWTTILKHKNPCHTTPSVCTFLW